MPDCQYTYTRKITNNSQTIILGMLCREPIAKDRHICHPSWLWPGPVEKQGERVAERLQEQARKKRKLEKQMDDSHLQNKHRLVQVMKRLKSEQERQPGKKTRDVVKLRDEEKRLNQVSIIKTSNL